MKKLKKKNIGLATGVALSILGGTSIVQAETPVDVNYYSDYNEFLKVTEEAEQLSKEQDFLQQSQEIKMYDGKTKSDIVLNLVETDEPGVYVEEGNNPKSSFTYKYSHYTQQSSNKNNRKFQIAEISQSNYTSITQSYSFTMSNTTTTNWTVTGKVSGETQLGNDLLAKAKASLGLSVARSATTTKGTVLQSNVKVPSKSTVTCITYLKGGYSGGVAYYNKYSSGGTLVGQVSYTNQSAWAPTPNGFTIDLVEH